MPTYAVSSERESEVFLGGKTHICLSSATTVLPVGRAKRPFCGSWIWASETTMAVSSLLCGRDEDGSELEKAMPCFFGLRTRAVSDRDRASPRASAVLFVSSAGVVVESGPCTVLATCGSSPLASLSALLRKTLRRFVARKTGPLSLSSIVLRMSNIEVVVMDSLRCDMWSLSSRLGRPVHVHLAAFYLVRYGLIVSSSKSTTSMHSMVLTKDR
jgi:hypothetical protein